MLIFEERKWIQAPFETEDELEAVVRDNAEAIFGASSIFLPKLLFQTAQGAGAIPDGFVIDLASRQWYVVEVELARHGVWTHIAPQVAKQTIAAAQPISRQLLTELVVERAREESGTLEKFGELGIEPIDIRRVLAEILATRPIIGIPIDSISRDLQEWATTLKSEVKLWVIRKFIEFGHPDKVLYEVPDEYRPALDTQENARGGLTRFDVVLLDLIRDGMIAAGDRLYLTYAPKTLGTRRKRSLEAKTYVGALQSDGSIEVLDHTFSSPSYAALFAIGEAGSERKTINGWLAWKTITGETLADLRETYLHRRPPNEQESFPIPLESEV